MKQFRNLGDKLISFTSFSLNNSSLARSTSSKVGVSHKVLTENWTKESFDRSFKDFIFRENKKRNLFHHRKLPKN